MMATKVKVKERVAGVRARATAKESVDLQRSRPKNKSRKLRRGEVPAQSPEDRLWTARHEAGHAVLIGCRFHDIKLVSIDPDQIGDSGIRGLVESRRRPSAEDLKSRWDLHTKGNYSSLSSKAVEFLQERGGVESWGKRSISDVRREVEVEAIGCLAGPAVDYVRRGSLRET